MAAHIQIQCIKSVAAATEAGFGRRRRDGSFQKNRICLVGYNNNSRRKWLRMWAVDRSNINSGDEDGGGSVSSSTGNNSSSNSNSKKKGGVSSSAAAASNSNYVVPLEKSSCITRPLNEILRDLNKRIPDNIIKTTTDHRDSTFLPWYHANRMLSFYAPGWCGEIRDVIFSDNGTVTVVYRVTIRGSDDEAFRESTGTVSSADGCGVDPVAAAEEIAFCRACARFGLGLYLYHEE